LVAVTRNVYATPFVSPVTCALVVDGPTCMGVCAAPSIYGVTV
jgi:hypothetical protein